MKEPKGILFDLDGTLTDYQAGARAGLEAAWEFLKNYRDIPFDRFENAYWQVIKEESKTTSSKGIQYPAKQNRMIRFQKTLYILDIQDDVDTAVMAEIYGTGRAEGARLFPGTREVLERLAKKYRLGVITEGNYETQYAQIKGNSLEDFFFALIISCETPYHKPDIRLYELAIRKMEMNAEDMIMVGDRVDWDLRPAKALGCTTILMMNNVTPQDLDESVDYTANSIMDLERLLEGC